MEREIPRSRLKRKFALFPKRIYIASRMKTYFVWLDFYYAHQRRTPFNEWHDAEYFLRKHIEGDDA